MPEVKLCQVCQLEQLWWQDGELVVAEVKHSQLGELEQLWRQGCEPHSAQVKFRCPAGLSLLYHLQHFFICHRPYSSLIDNEDRITRHPPRLPVPFSS